MGDKIGEIIKKGLPKDITEYELILDKVYLIGINDCLNILEKDAKILEENENVRNNRSFR